VPTGGAVCDVDGHTLRMPDGTTQDCAPFLCEAGSCKNTCSTNSECAPGQVCLLNGTCGPDDNLPGIAFSGENNCACSTPGRGANYGAFASLIALLLLRRRRRP
jgi:MYXO-CTERM domain-containing protein